MADKVKVVDVTARDGLQNEPNPVSTQDKLALIEKLNLGGYFLIVWDLVRFARQHGYRTDELIRIIESLG